MYDLVIRDGTLVDGTGAPSRRADVAVDGDRIVAVGDDLGAGRREIDATGLLVTSGWVDIHSHYNGQATWDPYLTPSSWNDVTTVAMGNCGVGFAPVKPDEHEYLIQLMEGVEDIPGSALSLGIEWDWESFPEYLDALDRRRFAADIATHWVRDRKRGEKLPLEWIAERQTQATARFYGMLDRGVVAPGILPGRLLRGPQAAPSA
jgi:N-acyl-D-aspartate/D-glutamate deacylase